MGFPYESLIPPAILLDTDGLTREEFAKKLFIFEKSMVNIHHGLHGIATLLHLPVTEQYKTFLESEEQNITFFGSTIKKLYFETKISESIYNKYNPATPEKIKYYNHVHYIVDEYIETYLGHRKQVNTDFGYAAQKGEIYYNKSDEEREYIDRIVNIAEERFEDNPPIYHTEMIVRPVKIKNVINKFHSIKSLCKQFPMFHPDFMYDFNQSSGRISVDDHGKYYWMKKDDKYYLDKEKTFNTIQAAIYHYKKGKKKEDGEDEYERQMGYSSLIMTAEAIRHNKKNLMFWMGIGESITNFIKKHPEVAARRENAVWDGYTSLFAKSNNMTHSELLRYRMLGMIPRDLEDVIHYDSSRDLI